jgi:hypothetical protein
VIQYETALKADDFLVLVHGTADDMARAKIILGTSGATSVDLHEPHAATISAAA